MMKKNDMYRICPITYELLQNDEKYSKKGIKKLSPELQTLQDLPFSAEQQRQEATKRADKMSIQGVQLKLSSKLSLKTQTFEPCDLGGTFILKPQNAHYLELPENEDLSMRLAQDIIEVPLHGMIYGADNRLTYFIKRFDRIARGQKLPVEDFAQLAGLTRDVKYNYSMEKLIPIIDKYCTFPILERSKLFTRTLFNYLIGNEDMHLKNFSLISRKDKVELAPAYDFINTTIAIVNAKEEIALPLNGKKNNLKRNDLIEYYGIKKLGLNEIVIQETVSLFQKLLPKWEKIIKISFLSDQGKQDYLRVLSNRAACLKL